MCGRVVECLQRTRKGCGSEILEMNLEKAGWYALRNLVLGSAITDMLKACASYRRD